jgi:hypothetical protein
VPSHPPSPLHPPISFSPPPSPADAPSSHATSPAPSTFASRMTSPAVNPLALSDHDSEPDQKVDPVPLPPADLDSDYEPAVDLQSPSPPLPVHNHQPRGRPRGRPRGQARGQPRGQGQGHAPAPAQPCMPVVLNCACIPYNDLWPPHRLSAYGNLFAPSAMLNTG